MSDSSLHEDSATDTDRAVPPRSPIADRIPPDALSNPVRVASFWTAALLPMGYLVLFAWGLDSLDRAGLFVALVAANVVALVLGRPTSGE